MKWISEQSIFYIDKHSTNQLWIENNVWITILLKLLIHSLFFLNKTFAALVASRWNLSPASVSFYRTYIPIDELTIKQPDGCSHGKMFWSVFPWLRKFKWQKSDVTTHVSYVENCVCVAKCSMLNSRFRKLELRFCVVCILCVSCVFSPTRPFYIFVNPIIFVSMFYTRWTKVHV